MPEKRRFPHTAEALRTFFRKKKVTDFAPLEAFLGLKPGDVRQPRRAPKPSRFDPDDAVFRSQDVARLDSKGV